jgi:hypothetical protein
VKLYLFTVSCLVKLCVHLGQLNRCLGLVGVVEEVLKVPLLCLRR